MAKLRGCTTCRYITCRCGEDQTNWKTLDELGVLLMKAIRKLSVEERKRLAAALLDDLRKPVGALVREEEMKAKILPIRALKLGPTQFQAEVEHLQAEGHMPSLPELLDVIADTRKLFVPLILEARKRRRKS